MVVGLSELRRHEHLLQRPNQRYGRDVSERADQVVLELVAYRQPDVFLNELRALHGWPNVSDWQRDDFLAGTERADERVYVSERFLRDERRAGNLRQLQNLGGPIPARV